MDTRFPINNWGLLTMNRPQINEYNQNIITQKTTLQEYRINQLGKYATFTDENLGIDIIKNPELDPFKELTGFPAQDFLVNKWIPYHPNKGFIACHHTDFLSAEHLLYVEQNNPKKPSWKQYPESFKDSTWKDYYFFKEFDARIEYRPFANRVVNDNWQFSYGLISYYLSRDTGMKQRPAIHKGVFFVEPEPLKYIMETSQFSKIYKMLREIGTWMTHDMTGHMSLDFNPDGGTPETECYRNLKVSKLKSWEIFYGSRLDSRSQSWSFVADEQRRFGLHLDLAKIFYQRNPLLKSKLEKHMEDFWSLMIDAIESKDRNRKKMPRYSESQYKVEVARYFMKLYLFCAMRIVPHDDLVLWIKKLRIEGVFAEIWMLNIPEQNLLALFSKNSGAPYNKVGVNASKSAWKLENIGFIPHKEFFGQVHERLEKFQK